MTEADLEPDYLEELAQVLRAGLRAQTVSVRELLSWFGVRRRGYLVVQEIREALREKGLVTSPDFQEVHIDAHVAVLLDTPPSSATIPQVVAPEDPVQGAVEEFAVAVVDPTFRLSRLPSASRQVAFVSPNDPVERAVTLMLANGYSQLAVLTTPRELKGVVSWKSIGEARALRGAVVTVGDCMTAAHERPGNESVFRALTTIVEHDYVLVRAPDRTIAGIVTASDLSEQFRQLAEPFLLIGEIENHLRQILGSCLREGDLVGLLLVGEEAPRTVSDLTFGQYHRAFSNPSIWTRTRLSIDRDVFCEHLDAVRVVRNDVMHFDPDPFEEEQLATLRNFTELVRKLAECRMPEA